MLVQHRAMTGDATIDEAIREIGLLEDEEVDLLGSAFALALLDDPGADLDMAESVIADIEDDLASYFDLEDPESRAIILAEVIAGRHRFTGNAENYDDPGNADLLRVVETRRGLPVALAIVYADLARQRGWAAEVLNVPGHVLVRIGSREAGQVIDPFNHGAPVDEAGISALLASHYRRPVPPIQRDFAAMTNREVLVRLLNNPAGRAEAARDFERARELYRRMVAIAPADLTGWWGCARMAVAMGDPDEIRADLAAMLEITRDPHMRARISKMLEREQERRERR